MFLGPSKKTPFRFRFLEIMNLILVKVFPKIKFFTILRDKNRSNAIKNFMKSHPEGSPLGKILSVDVHEKLSKKDFYKNYVSKRRPVIFKGGIKDWPCSKKWSFDFLKEKYGEDEYHIVAPEGFLCKDEIKTYKINGDSAGKFKFKDIMAQILENKIVYLRLFPLLENHPELLKDIDSLWLKKMSRSVLGAIYHTFLGPKGRKSHSHSGSSGFFSMMVRGEKEWEFWDTSYYPLLNISINSDGDFYSDISRVEENIYEKYPHYKYIDRYICTLEEGDILYCPVWIFHTAKNNSLSLALRYGVFDPIDLLKSSLGFLIIKISLSGLPKLLWHSLTGKSHDREEHRSTPKIIKR